MFEDGQDTGMVNAPVEDAVHGGEVCDVPGGAAVSMLRSMLPFATDEGFAHGVSGVGIKDIC